MADSLRILQENKEAPCIDPKQGTGEKSIGYFGFDPDARP